MLKRNITLSDLFKSTNLEYLDSTSWKKCCLKFFYKSHSSRKWISFSTLFDEQSWHILRFSGILGSWYQSVSILNLWLLDCNFAPAWRCFSFLIRSKYSDLLTSNFFVRWQHVHLVLFEVIIDSLLYFCQLRVDQFGLYKNSSAIPEL